MAETCKRESIVKTNSGWVGQSRIKLFRENTETTYFCAIAFNSILFSLAST